MKRSLKMLFFTTFSFLFCFMCIGYAQLSDALTINGTASMTEPETLYITEIAGTTGSVSEAQIVPLTSIDSTLNLGSNPTSVVTMRITVKNNATVPYGFNAIRYISEAYSNPSIRVETDLERKTVDNKGVVQNPEAAIQPGTTHTFTATFSYAGTDTSNPKLTSVINYEFLPWDSITPNVDAGLAGDVLDQFEDILNNVDNPQSYQMLIDQMAKQAEANRYSDDYVANFTDAYEGDKALLTELFGSDNLSININGEEVRVQVIIKYEDVSSAYEGMEMTLYMTTHSLEKSGGWFATSTASPIYASVFSVSEVDGKAVWSQIGQMYTGEGRINGYDGAYFGEGSFDTGSWRSTVAYENAEIGSTIEEVLAAVRS